MFSKKGKSTKGTELSLGVRRALAIGGTLAVAVSLVACTEDDTAKEEKVKDVSKKENESNKSNSTVNLDSSIKSFLDQTVAETDKVIKTMITENFDSVEGLYAYPVEVTKLGSTIEMNIGISDISVPKQNVSSYDGFMDKVKDLEEGTKGLALVEYADNNIVSVQVYQLEHSFEDLQKSISKYEYTESKDGEKSDKEEEKGYHNLTAEDWKGMALLTAREAVAAELAPIFIVPNTSVTASKDLVDTYVYIIAGDLKKVENGKTTLGTYEGKNITLDFEVEAEENEIGFPSWIYVITQDGKIKNVELQSFPEADGKIMAEGVMTYINVTSAENVTEKD